jgi:hypothetical protein
LLSAANRFLHFLCTACGDFGKLRAKIFLARIHSLQNPHRRVVCRSVFHSILHRENWQKSAAEIFLTCTKNIELTAAPFARKVRFALTKNLQEKPTSEFKREAGSWPFEIALASADI